MFVSLFSLRECLHIYYFCLCDTSQKHEEINKTIYIYIYIYIYIKEKDMLKRMDINIHSMLIYKDRNSYVLSQEITQ